jgi:hypothetical protein
MTRLLLAIMALAMAQTIFKAELTGYPPGTNLINQIDDIGLAFSNNMGEAIDISPASDNNFETAIYLEKDNSLQLLLPGKKGKVSYPTESFHISNGDRSGKGRIKLVKVAVRSKKFSRSWTYELQDTLNWQYIRFPEVFWLGKSGSITITPVEQMDNNDLQYRISELAFSWE